MSQMPPPPPPPPGYGQQGFPPNPPGGFPPGGNYPPTGGYPPAGGFVPGNYPQGMMPMGIPRTSAAAVASLVFGILGCLQITAAIAIIAGFIGIAATSKPNVKGRGMAVTGTVLGFLFLLGGLCIGGGSAYWFTSTAPQRAVANRFVEALSAGNTQAAAAECTDKVSADDIAAYAAKMQGWGAVQHYAFAHKMGANGEAVEEAVVDGKGMQHPSHFDLINDNGVWKINSVTLAP